MGQRLSSEEEVVRVKEAAGSLLFDAMSEGGAVPEVTVVHPLLLANPDQGSSSQDCLQRHLQQLQDHIGIRAPTYLKDLIGRLSAFSEEPRVTGLVGSVVTMVIDIAYSSSRRSSGVKGNAVGPTSSQRIRELREAMEEYLKRCRINLSDKSRLIEDTSRLEAEVSLKLTQLTSCLLKGDCSSRSLRLWACAAAFHTQMLVHLATLEGKTEPLSARAALERYEEDLAQLIPAYRHYKTSTVNVAKCRGGLVSPEVLEEGAMTGLTVTDRELGKSVTIPLSSLQTGMEERRKSSAGDSDSSTDSSIVNLDLITSDQYAGAYLDYLFSNKGPVSELHQYFTRAAQNLEMLSTVGGCSEESGFEQNKGVCCSDPAEGEHGEAEEPEKREQEEEEEEDREKLSIVETQPEESRTHIHHSAATL